MANVSNIDTSQSDTATEISDTTQAGIAMQMPWTYLGINIGHYDRADVIAEIKRQYRMAKKASFVRAAIQHWWNRSRTLLSSTESLSWRAIADYRTLGNKCTLFYFLNSVKILNKDCEGNITLDVGGATGAAICRT